MLVSKLVFMQTGGQADQYIRPFHTNINQDGMKAIQEATHSGQVITSNGLQSVADNVIKLKSQHEGVASIDNGWNATRMRFYMEVQDGDDYANSKLMYIITGFTDHFGLSFNNSIDPNMRIYFNNLIRVNQIKIMTPSGPQIQKRFMDKGMFLLGQRGVSYDGFKQVSLRPSDVLSALSHGILSDEQDLFDSTSTFLNGPLTANRYHFSAPVYLESILNSYVTNANKSQFSGNEEHIFANAAKANNVSNPIMGNTFVQKLRYATSYVQNGFITYSELLNISPNTNSVVNVIKNKSNVTQVANGLSVAPSDSAGWGGASAENIEALKIVQSVPTIMMDTMIALVSVSSTNDTLNGQIITTINGYESFTDNLDMSGLLHIFIQRFEQEIMVPLTLYGNRKVQVMLHMDMSGESMVKIKLDDNHWYDFISPSFCDGIFNSMITNSQSNLHLMANDLNNVIHNLDTSFGEVNYQPNSPIYQPHQPMMHQPSTFDRITSF